MDSINTVPGLTRFANRAILPKFPDLTRFCSENFLKFLKSKGVKQTKVTNFFDTVEQNTEKPGLSGQKFYKLPLEEQDEALELLSDED